MTAGGQRCIQHFWTIFTNTATTVALSIAYMFPYNTVHDIRVTACFELFCIYTVQFFILLLLEMKIAYK